MTIRNHFMRDESFTLKNNIFYQRGVIPPHSFESTYLKLRDREERLYTDEVIKTLPDFPAGHRFKNEWDIRKHSLYHLLDYLKKKSSIESILEIGCGNGWLANNLAITLNAEVCAVDINETELIQGAKIFSRQNLLFVHADILGQPFDVASFDVIILAGTIQYFPDIKAIIHKLLTLLKPSGEIHIFDSPLYHQSTDIEKAKLRSARHFTSLGIPIMSEHYHYHEWNSLRDFNYEVLSDPRSIINRIKRKFVPLSPFPWIKIFPA